MPSERADAYTGYRATVTLRPGDLDKGHRAFYLPAGISVQDRSDSRLALYG